MSISSAETAAPSRPSSFRWLIQLLSSTVGSKYIVALTGLALTGFVIVHMLGNLQVFLGRDAYNRYAQSLKDMGPLLWIARGGLLTMFAIHIVLALRLKKRNLDARPIGYKYERTLEASWVSRYMVLTGLVVLAFVFFHLAHFTFGWLGRSPDGAGHEVSYRDLQDADYKKKSGDERHDTYRMFVEGFRSVPMAAAYVACMIFLGLHLLHGVRSVFQTLGLNHKKYNVMFAALAYGVAGTVALANIFMPLAVLFRLVGADVP